MKRVLLILAICLALSLVFRLWRFGTENDPHRRTSDRVPPGPGTMTVRDSQPLCGRRLCRRQKPHH